MCIPDGFRDRYYMVDDAMQTISKDWEGLNKEINGRWPWMSATRGSVRNDVILALGAGLPVKVLMSW